MRVNVVTLNPTTLKAVIPTAKVETAKEATTISPQVPAKTQIARTLNHLACEKRKKENEAVDPKTHDAKEITTEKAKKIKQKEETEKEEKKQMKEDSIQLNKLKHKDNPP